MFRRYRTAYVLGFILLGHGGNFISKTEGHPFSEPSTYTSTSQMTSKLTAKDFVPDSNLDKPVWRHAHWLRVDHDAFSSATFPQSATEIATVWTPAYVYFAFRCKYTTLNLYEGGDPGKDFLKLWNRDVVEVFLNPRPEHMKQYYEFEVAPNNLWVDLAINLAKTPFTDPRWDSGYEHATHIDAANHLWTCEMRIPVASVNEGKPLAAHAEWRLNLYRIDGPGDDTQRRFLSWSPVHAEHPSFHTPWSFGLIRFAE